MISENEELVHQLCIKNPEFERLFKEHVCFEQDLEALYSLKFFPPEVEQNVKEIKIRKLRGKERMTRIIDEYKLNK